MLTRRAYKRYVRKGGTKSKKSKSSDIIDTSELEKPKVFSIQDVHDFLLRKNPNRICCPTLSWSIFCATMLLIHDRGVGH